MINKIVTLYVDDSSIRLLVTSGKQIKKWAELPLEPGLVEGAVVIKEAEVAAKIKQLLKKQGEEARRVIVGLSGLLCLTRLISLPLLPKEMLTEAVMREAKKTLPLPLEQLYVSWQALPPVKGKARVFLVAVRRKTADSLLRTLRQAGLRPYFMDLKPLALARVVGEETAVIVDVQPTEFDIVIMVDGVPHPVRTVPFPSRALSWQKKLPMIKDELDRTIKFYNDNNQEKPLASSVPIYVSGELADESELYQSLSEKVGHPVSPLSSPLKSSEPEEAGRSALLRSAPAKSAEELAPNRYLVNIGLALTELSLENEAGLSVVNLNALPTAEQPKPRSTTSRTKFVAIPIVLVVVFLLVPLVMRVQDASADIASTRSQLDIANQVIKQRLLQQEELTASITELEAKLAETQETRNAFSRALTSLDKQGSSVNGDLRETTSALPGTVSLTSVRYAGDTLLISGNSSSETDVLAYARSLKTSGRFSEVIIASVNRVEHGAMDFTLMLITKGGS